MAIIGYHRRGVACRHNSATPRHFPSCLPFGAPHRALGRPRLPGRVRCGAGPPLPFHPPSLSAKKTSGGENIPVSIEVRCALLGSLLHASNNGARFCNTATLYLHQSACFCASPHTKKNICFNRPLYFGHFQYGIIYYQYSSTTPVLIFLPIPHPNPLLLSHTPVIVGNSTDMALCIP